MHFLPNRNTGSMRTFPATALLAVLSVTLLWACAPEDGSALEAARDAGLRAGFAIEPPYAFVDSAGVVTGEAPDVLRHGAGELGIDRVEWVPLEFPELIPSLLEGSIDVIAAGMFITPARLERLRFSRPTACVEPVLVTRRPACADCRIAVLQGSVEQAALRDTAIVSEGVVVVPDIGTGIAAIRSGAADAMAISGPTGRAIARAEPDLAIRPHTFPEAVAQEATGCAAFAFRPEDEELAAAFDSVLERFVGSAAHIRISRRFGFTASEIPCPAGPPRVTSGRADACFPVTVRPDAG